ncbi:MAG: hypothetical protein EZS28_022553 [Streblomastix strix]|uniref:Nucleoporin Nup54 alpha-helical domain-containing protein n=1 Tax=Streblomastix strix TaxID=222440 RepID=A0A5J4VH65_9EUKA|nr:MAG: hypothetical protein EZS28_022553 [Streblomastix strix]
MFDSLCKRAEQQTQMFNVILNRLESIHQLQKELENENKRIGLKQRVSEIRQNQKVLRARIVNLMAKLGALEMEGPIRVNEKQLTTTLQEIEEVITSPNQGVQIQLVSLQPQIHRSRDALIRAQRSEPTLEGESRDRFNTILSRMKLNVTGMNRILNDVHGDIEILEEGSRIRSDPKSVQRIKDIDLDDDPQDQSNDGFVSSSHQSL